MATFTLRLPDADLEELRYLADVTGASVGALIKGAIRRHLARREQARAFLTEHGDCLDQLKTAEVEGLALALVGAP